MTFKIKTFTFLCTRSSVEIWKETRTIGYSYIWPPLYISWRNRSGVGQRLHVLMRYKMKFTDGTTTYLWDPYFKGPDWT